MIQDRSEAAMNINKTSEQVCGLLQGCSLLQSAPGARSNCSTDDHHEESDIILNWAHYNWSHIRPSKRRPIYLLLYMLQWGSDS